MNLFRAIGRRAFGRSVIVALMVVAWTNVSVVHAGTSSVIDDVVVTPSRSNQVSWTPFTALLPAPSGAAFFVPPTPLPGRPGDVIWATKSATPAGDIFGMQATTPESVPNIPTTNRPVEVWRIMYHTVNRSGDSRAATALLMVDRANASKSKIVVSMHGWTGLGDSCGLFSSPLGGLLAQGANFLGMMSEGYTVVMPDGPGSTVPGRVTTLISGDSSRALLDAAYATHLFAGALPSVMMQGHSLGGAMVIPTGGEATTYAPQLRVTGIVSMAGAGITGPGASVFDAARTSASGLSTDVANSIAYVLALEAAYGPAVVPLSRYLTPLGLKLAAQIDTMCNNAAAALVSLYGYDRVIKAPLPPMDPGALSRVSPTPTLMVIGLNDQVVDPLAQHQAYRLLCAAGQPVTWLELVGDHGTVNSTAFQDTVVFRPWFKTAASGGRPAGSCAPVVPLVSRLFTYTTAYVMNALGVRTPPGSTVTMAATGNCAVRKGRLEPRSGGTCTITFSSKKGARNVARETVEVRVLSI